MRKRRQAFKMPARLSQLAMFAVLLICTFTPLHACLQVDADQVLVHYWVEEGFVASRVTLSCETPTAQAMASCLSRNATNGAPHRDVSELPSGMYEFE